MADAVQVFPPNYRLSDNSTGAPISGAVIRFYTAGTTTPKTVYADQDLTTALGTSVTTDSLGAPTSDGTTKTLVYTDTSAYKVRIETAGGTLIVEHDNVKGAVTSGTGSTTVVSTRTVETKSLDYTIVAADQGKAFASNCTSTDVVFTLPSAAASTVGNGWLSTICHAGTANQTIISTVSSETITSGALSYGTALALSNSGEEVTLISDGGNWRVFNHVGPHIKRGQGVLTIADRLAAAPGSPPAQGTLYIATGAATWGSTSVANHDVVMHTTAGAYVKITPPTDCGWTAFVQDEDETYQFQGSAWVQLVTKAASTAQMVAASSNLVLATPGNLRSHPEMAKVRGAVTYSAGTPTLTAGSQGVSSITDTGTGVLTVNLSANFANTNYHVFATGFASASATQIIYCSTKNVGSFVLTVTNWNGTAGDPGGIDFLALGALA